MRTNDGGLSRAARWRIASLVVVHVLIAAHIIHWRLAGRTLSSIQLSDAGRFAAEGVATASLFFFAALLVVTLVFGRVFCAWGCHMLALQEVCRYLLRRAGVRPRLIRSRVVWVIPLYAAFYIFFQPAVERLWRGAAWPATRLALTSNALWANLPGPSEAVVGVLVCGVVMVYLLGSLSFCKYVCPYGALFALSDRLALGRVRLTGECDGCARCTAACTTGVRVHEEVQRLNMVADAGCMRCLECVSACPREVLAYRFGRPALVAGSRAGLTRYAFSYGEDALLLVVFAISCFALHGLYNVVPLLVALGASVLLGYLAVMALRMFRAPTVLLRGLVLRRADRWSRAGAGFVAACAVLFVFVGHSAFIQYHQLRAGAALSELEFPRLRHGYARRDRRLARAAAAHLQRCSRYGLVDTVDWQMQSAWLARVLGDSPEVEHHLRRAIALDPQQPVAYFNLGKELTRQGRAGEAAQAFAAAVRLAPSLAQVVPGDPAAGGS